MKIAELKKINKAGTLAQLYFKAEDFTSVATERVSKTNNNSENKKLSVLYILYFYPHYCHIKLTHIDRKPRRNANLTSKLVF